TRQEAVLRITNTRATPNAVIPNHEEDEGSRKPRMSAQASSGFTDHRRDPALALGMTSARCFWFAWTLNCERGRSRLTPSPNHGHGSSQTSAHVEGQITLRAFDLSFAGLAGELLIGFNDLADA